MRLLSIPNPTVPTYYDPSTRPSNVTFRGASPVSDTPHYPLSVVEPTLHQSVTPSRSILRSSSPSVHRSLPYGPYNRSRASSLAPQDQDGVGFPHSTQTPQTTECLTTSQSAPPATRGTSQTPKSTRGTSQTPQQTRTTSKTPSSTRAQQIRSSRAPSQPPSHSPFPVVQHNPTARTLYVTNGIISPVLLDIPLPNSRPESVPTDVVEEDSASTGSADDSSSDSSDSSLSKSEEEDDDEDKIAKPPGEPGRPGSGGYNLMQEVNWVPKEFLKLRKYIYGCIERYLDETKCYKDQDTDALKDVCDMVKKKFPDVMQFQRIWPVKDVLRMRLKYTTQRARRRNNDAIASRKSHKLRESKRSKKSRSHT